MDSFTLRRPASSCPCPEPAACLPAGAHAQGSYKHGHHRVSSLACWQGAALQSRVAQRTGGGEHRCRALHPGFALERCQRHLCSRQLLGARTVPERRSSLRHAGAVRAIEHGARASSQQQAPQGAGQTEQKPRSCRSRSFRSWCDQAPRGAAGQKEETIKPAVRVRARPRRGQTGTPALLEELQAECMACRQQSRDLILAPDLEAQLERELPCERLLLARRATGRARLKEGTSQRRARRCR
jgi:hypothetical protein